MTTAFRLSPRQAELAAELVPLIRTLARVTKSAFPAAVFGDLVSAGHDACMGVVARWDPDNGTPLHGFARKRLQGAIFDAALDEKKRARRAMHGLMEAELRSGDDEAPREQEARSLSEAIDGLSPREEAMAGLRGSVAAMATTLFLDKIRLEGEEALIARETESRRGAVVQQAIALLDADEQALANVLYYEKLTVNEAAVRLKTSRSSISRRHSLLKRKLAELILKLDAELAPAPRRKKVSTSAGSTR